MPELPLSTDDIRRCIDFYRPNDALYMSMFELLERRANGESLDHGDDLAASMLVRWGEEITRRHRMTSGSARLYAELDTITGGLPEFLAARRNDAWEQDGYRPFTLTCLGEGYVLFGFRARINGDSCPDPLIKVWIELATRTAAVISVETLTGLLRYPDIPEGVDQYASDLLAELQQRRPAMRVKAVEYPGTEAA